MNRIVLLIFSCLSLAANAQEETHDADSVPVILPDTGEKYKPVDTVRIKSYAERFDPRKASLYAAILPGMGQIYNKKYWKLPLVYGGFGWIGYWLTLRQNQYTDYKNQLFDILRTGTNSKDPRITEEIVRPAIDKVRRERDFMIILMGGMYILQIIDAHVDAHLKEFDVNPDLQVKFRPTFNSDMLIGRQAGLSITFTF